MSYHQDASPKPVRAYPPDPAGTSSPASKEPVAAEPGALRYVTLDGRERHWPTTGNWQATNLGPFDLMQLRTHLLLALKLVDADAVRRGLLPGERP